MNKRTCPSCGGRSYSSYSGPDWDCPYCKTNLGDIPDELTETPKDNQEEETPLNMMEILADLVMN